MNLIPNTHGSDTWRKKLDGAEADDFFVPAPAMAGGENRGNQPGCHLAIQEGVKGWPVHALPTRRWHERGAPKEIRGRRSEMTQVKRGKRAERS